MAQFPATGETDTGEQEPEKKKSTLPRLTNLRDNRTNGDLPLVQMADSE